MSSGTYGARSVVVLALGHWVRLIAYRAFSSFLNLDVVVSGRGGQDAPFAFR